MTSAAATSAIGGLHSRARHVSGPRSENNQAVGIFPTTTRHAIHARSTNKANCPAAPSFSSARKARIRTAVHASYVVIFGIFVYSAYSLRSIGARSGHRRNYRSAVPAIRKPKVVFLSNGLSRGRKDIHRDARPMENFRPWKWRRKHGEKERDQSSDGEVCQYRHEWQLALYPTCSALHEIDMQFHQDFTLINNGHYRDVFSYSQLHDGRAMVMKELRLEWELDDEGRLESHRRDAVAMGRLTNSNHIPNIYASCANAQIVDVSPDGDLEQHVLMEGDDHRNYTSVEKLTIAVQVAEAIADVHEAGIAHTDIAPKQFLLLDGRYQLSDFNRCRFLQEQDDGTQCLFRIRNSPGKGRSPEEYRDGALSPKIDVYSMGNVYYYMLMGFKYFDGYKSREAQSIVKKGGRPPLSSEVKNSKDPAIQHIIQGMRQAQAQKAEDRPPAREIAKHLAEALKSIPGSDQVQL